MGQLSPRLAPVAGAAMDEIIPNLWVGGLAAIPEAKRLGMKVFGVREQQRDPNDDEWLPVMLGDCRRNMDAAAAIIGSYMDKGMPLLVHCAVGRERSALAVAWYLHKKRDMSLDGAYALLMERRPMVIDRREWLDNYPFGQAIDPTCSVVPMFKTRPAEREIYKTLWSNDRYREVAPGEGCVAEFLMQAKPRLGATMVDLGCGTGRASLLLALPPPMGANLKVTMLDFADNCLDEDIRKIAEQQPEALKFIEADLTKHLPVTAVYGFCTDVMEHIPTQDVNKVLNNCLMACQHVFFQIATQDDVLGGIVGHPLHLTVRPYEWWLQMFNDRKCVIHWSKDFGNHCCFYVSAWTSGKEITETGSLNIEAEIARANVKKNIGPQFFDTNLALPTKQQDGTHKVECVHDDPCATGAHGAAVRLLKNIILPDGRAFEKYFSDNGMEFKPENIEAVTFGPFEPTGDEGENPADEVRILYWWGNSNLYKSFTLAEWQESLTTVGAVPFRWMQVSPHDTVTDEVMILGGGPSLNEFEFEIKAKRMDGMKLITLNGTYNWCIERGLTPSAQIIVDARSFNARFTKPVLDTCRYLIASQCDPSVLEGLPKDKTYLWHTGAGANKDLLDEAYDNKWWWVPGGSTVLLRAIPLMRMLGYKRFHLYGCDSCVMGDNHHAYAQAENDGSILLPTVTSVSDRVFMTTVWQASQASEFIDLVKYLGDEIELDVKGDGLLAHILESGAKLAAQDEFSLI